MHQFLLRCRVHGASTLGGARFAAGADMIDAPYIFHQPRRPLPVARVAVHPCSHAATYSLGHFAFAPLCVNTLSHFLDLFLYLRCGLAVAVAVVRGVGGDEERCDRDAECGCDEGGGGCKCVVPRVGHRGEEL